MELTKRQRYIKSKRMVNVDRYNKNNGGLIY